MTQAEAEKIMRDMFPKRDILVYPGYTAGGTNGEPPECEVGLGSYNFADKLVAWSCHGQGQTWKEAVTNALVRETRHQTETTRGR